MKTIMKKIMLLLLLALGIWLEYPNRNITKTFNYLTLGKGEVLEKAKEISKSNKYQLSYVQCNGNGFSFYQPYANMIEVTDEEKWDFDEAEEGIKSNKYGLCKIYNPHLEVEWQEKEENFRATWSFVEDDFVIRIL